MGMETCRPRTQQRNLYWERIHNTAERAEYMLESVYSLLDARQDREAERQLNLLADMIRDLHGGDR